MQKNRISRDASLQDSYSLLLFEISPGVSLKRNPWFQSLITLIMSTIFPYSVVTRYCPIRQLKVTIKSANGRSPEHVQYLGYHIADTYYIGLQQVRTSSSSHHDSCLSQVFKVCVEPVLMMTHTHRLGHGTKILEKRCDIRLLMKTKNLHWKKNPKFGNVAIPQVCIILALYFFSYLRQ